MLGSCGYGKKRSDVDLILTGLYESVDESRFWRMTCVFGCLMALRYIREGIPVWDSVDHAE